MGPFDLRSIASTCATGALCMAFVSVADMGRARAESSSWSTRTAPSERQRPAVGGGTAAPGNDWAPVGAVRKGAKRVRSESVPSKAAAGRTPPDRAAATGKSDDAAYEAFDQGRFLTALELAQKAAEQGEPQAHTLIGRILLEGLGVPADVVAASRWYAKGAELGDAEAAFALGLLSVRGHGIGKDVGKAAIHFETAARKGHPEANYNLGLLFLKGEGKPENAFRAAAHFAYAAEHGIAAAQYDLATMLAAGQGFPTANAFEAARWLERAAKAGHIAAEVEYAVLLIKGHGVPVDARRAVHFFERAADKGNAIAQNRLARCHANGLGTSKDVVQAAKWHLLARSAGLADPELDEMLAKMPRSERLTAEKAANQWAGERALE